MIRSVLIIVLLKERMKICEPNDETQTDVRTNNLTTTSPIYTPRHLNNGRSYIIWKCHLSSHCYCVSEGLSLKRAITCICVSATERALCILTTTLPFRPKYGRVSGTSISGEAVQPLLCSPLLTSLCQ